MKILFFLENYYLGGLDTFLINLINNWPDKDDEIFLACNQNHTGLNLLEKSIRRQYKLTKYDIPSFTGFFQLKEKNNPGNKAITIFLKLCAPFLKYLYIFWDIFALRRVLFEYNPDKLLIINGGYPGADLCRAAAIAWGISGRKSFHNIHGIALKPGWHIWLQEYITDRLVSRFTENFIMVSKAVTETLTSRKGIDKHKTMQIYNGITFQEQKNNLSFSEKLQNELGIPKDKPLCLMLASYHIHKNFDKGHSFAIKAFKQVLKQIPDAHLLICGYGSKQDINRVNKIIKTLNLEKNIHLSGFREDVPDLLGRSDMLLIASQTFESFCLATIEAMARKVPVVTTDVGAIPEIIKNGEGGYCVLKNDTDAYASNIIKLLRDSQLKKDQGKKGFQVYQKYFTAARMSKEYASLLKSKNPPLFSIIIPTYNNPGQLKEALNSVASQTFKDFEAIICDDGSTENTKEMIDTYNKKISIKYIWEKNWGGPARPRNNGIKAALGKYIAFLDSDDQWHPKKLEIVSKYLNKGDIFYHDLKNVKCRHLKKPIFRDLMINENALITSSVVAKKSVIEQAGGFPEEISSLKMTCVEDFDLWLKLARITDKFVYIPKALGTYWMGDGKVSQPCAKLIERLKIVYNKYLPFLENEDKRQAETILSYLLARTEYKIKNFSSSLVHFKHSALSKNFKIKIRSLAWIALIQSSMKKNEHI